MCGRYVINAIAADLQRAFSRVSNWAAVATVSYNVAPTQPVPIIRWQSGGAVALHARWGLIPAFARGEPGQFSTINARVESMRASPAYRDAWKRGQRCLIPASGFYEWQVVGDGKQPYYITCADQPLFAFAGLWDASTPPAGEPVISCTIITLPASPMMADIHNTRRREPAILRREDWDLWLHGDADAAFACLQPYRDDLRAAWPVSKRVNSPANNSEMLVQPAAIA
jgi:putative SOS response-associated peptidase YedK